MLVEYNDPFGLVTEYELYKKYPQAQHKIEYMFELQKAEKYLAGINYKLKNTAVLSSLSVN